MTIAASGQGRWREELEFPIDCRQSGFIPVLIFLDATPNPKLEQLKAAFLAEHGEVYIGVDAWQHLEIVAGSTMAKFLENYVRAPIQDLLQQSDCYLGDFLARWTDTSIEITVAGETLSIARTPSLGIDNLDADMPDDADDGIPGVLE